METFAIRTDEYLARGHYLRRRPAMVNRHSIAVDHQESPRRVIVDSTLEDPSVVDLRQKDSIPRIFQTVTRSRSAATRVCAKIFVASVRISSSWYRPEMCVRTSCFTPVLAANSAALAAVRCP